MFSMSTFLITNGTLLQQRRVIRVIRRKLRDAQNFLDLPNKMFSSFFRVSKESFLAIFEELSPHFPVHFRSTAVHPKIKFAAFLRFLGSGSYQHSVGNDMLTSMSQAEMSKTITEFLQLFHTHFCPKWIQMKKTAQEESDIKRAFYEKFRIPGIIGVVDGSHIRIQSPKQDQKHHFYNRKGYYSINAMFICDHNMIINFVDARYPGATHDAFVWKNSLPNMALLNDYNNGKTNTWILGDSGYPLLPYLMTPYRTVSNRQEELYNKYFCKARNIIERVIGVLKARFRCIIGDRGLLYTSTKATKIVNVCCALHNACIYYRNDWVNLDDVFEDDSEISIPYEEEEIDINVAKEIRKRIAENLLE